MARHRSPSGARPDPGPGAPSRAPGAAGTYRLPAPPTASLRGRATVAAVATGAIVAAGQSLVSQYPAALYPGGLHPGDPGEIAYVRLAAAAMVPVALHSPETSNPRLTVTPAIGGDQRAPDALGLPALDPESEVDVQSLTKAVDIGAKLAERASTLSRALTGGAPRAVLSGGQTYVLPTTGVFTSGFGARWGVTHYGIDLANSIGTPIYAVTDGIVEEAGPASGFGLWVVLRHADGTHSVYGHIDRSLVSVGQQVTAGQQIAELGNRGQSTGPHLHFEIWDVDGTKINPLPWLAGHGVRVPGTGTGTPD